VSQPTYCRLCESRCGLLADVEDGVLTALHPDPTDPTSAGYSCETAQASIAALRSPKRITEPMRRERGTLVPVSWETAITEIGAQLAQIRKTHGAQSTGVYLGEPVLRSSRSLVRSLSFGVGLGTPNILSELCLGAGPRLWITEQMLGVASTLRSDLGRAHYIVLLGGDQRQVGWGPMQAGMAAEAHIEHSRRTKKTKVIVADPRETGLAKDMDQHLQIRPGTEPFLMLGMLAAVVRGGWEDSQFVADYTTGMAELKALLQVWTVDRCAEICGIEAPELSGVALKFSRSAMAIVHPSASSFQNAHGALGAWAWLALHTVTANTLRPGGLYEAKGLFDLHPAIASVPMEGAPKTTTSQAPLQLLQAPATHLLSELKGGLRALVTVSGDPVSTLPAPEQTRTALGDLDLLVCLAQTEDATAAQADWVLPLTHPWEQADLTLHDSGTLPYRGIQWTTALVQPAGSARTAEQILRDLYRAARPGLRDSVWGRHLDLLARYVVSTNLEEWEHRAFDWSSEVDLTQLPEDARRLNLGQEDRAIWRLRNPDDRIHLMPPGVTDLLRAVDPPRVSAEYPFLLRSSQPRDRAPDSLHRDTPIGGLRVHPDAGFEDGARIRISTAHGSLVCQIEHDSSIRPDTLDLAPELQAQGSVLSPKDGADAQMGAPTLDGIPCKLQTV
jgi:anaerobic selenocysteine-containing dehydrogenase